MKFIRHLFTVFFILNCIAASPQCFTINSFPYQESFETGTNNWFSGGTNNDWAWGSPAKPTITAAGAGINCWITGGLTASLYASGERSWVQSPCFDFTTLDKPYISFLIFWEMERKYDGGNFQYSLDGGLTWINAGSSSDPEECNDHNWFNYSSIINLNGLVNNNQGWSGTIQATSGSCNGGGGSGQWLRASHCLAFLGHEPQVIFRFTFGSGTTCNGFDGLAFDDVYIGEAPFIPDDFDYTCNSATSVHLYDLIPDCHDSWKWDFGDGTSGTGNNIDHNYSTGGIYTVTLTAGGKCLPDSQVVKQVKLLTYTTQTTDVKCQGDNTGSASVNVTNGGPNISYSWSQDPSLNSSFASSLSSGTYQVTITDTSSCTLIVDIDVKEGPNARPVVKLGDDTVVCPGTSFILHPGSYYDYTWQDNSFDSFYVVKAKGVYSVTVENTSGCFASDTIIVAEDCLNDIILPNAFTPNGDGINDVFYVNGSETSDYKLLIYDRWGQLIFSTGNRDEGWTGFYKSNPAQEGFYNYLVNYSIQGEVRTKNGSIYLYR